MYYILRTSNSRIIAQFTELADAIKYCEDILEMSDSEYKILKYIL